MDKASSRFTLIFFGAAVGALFLAVAIPVFANLFMGLGVEIPNWALRLFPGHPLRALLFAAGVMLTILAALVVLLAVLLRRSPQA